MRPPSLIIDFSYHEWRLRDAPSSRGSRNVYSPIEYPGRRTAGNALAHLQDGKGLELHGSEYDARSWLRTYEFVVRGLDSLEPAAVFEMFAYRYASGMHHVAANVHRFNGPQSPEMFWLATLP